MSRATSNHTLPDEIWKSSGLDDFVAIDLETTGLDPTVDSIIEIGAIRFRNGRIAAKFNTLVNPHRSIPAFIKELTGITNEDLRSAPDIEVAALKFLETLPTDIPIIGHHVSFDLSFLDACEEMQDVFRPANLYGRVHDTSPFARFLQPCLDAYGLASLSQSFSVESKPCHRAADDAAATGELFTSLFSLGCAVPLTEIAQALRFVEGTNSALANSLKSIRKVVGSGWQPEFQAPPALGENDKRSVNYFAAEGEKRPSEPIPEKQIRQFYRESERFAAVLPGYEIRKEQVEMSALVADAFRNERIIMIEAGTGTGKSLGYLIPALLSSRRVIISTHTKNLQDQLFFDELPRLGSIFKFGFNAAVLKGRRNYLCRTKWKNWSLAPERIGSTQMREQLATLVRWTAATRTGDIAEIGAVRGSRSSSLFRLITSEPGFCTGRICGGKTECPLSRIRRLSASADLLIVNHSLVMADLNAESGILGEFDLAVFDEAHHLEDVATDQLGTDITSTMLKSALERMANLSKRNGELWVHISARQELGDLAHGLERISNSCVDLLGDVDVLFKSVSELLRSRMSDNSQYSEAFRYKDGEDVHGEIVQHGQPLYDEIKPICQDLTEIIRKLNDDGYDSIPAEPMQEIIAATDELNAHLASLETSLQADDSERVYWVEVPPEKQYPIHLRSAPLDVSQQVRSGLWDRLSSAILTSATLSTNSSVKGFTHISRRLGLELDNQDRYGASCFGSPFDYDSNCQSFCLPFLASPSENARDHNSQTASICSEIIEATGRNTLVLLTSYQALRQVERELNEELANPDANVIVQGRSGGKERLVRQFRNNQGAVLLGTDSFWEGIDLPGKSLEILVIPKLPFASPADPIISARIEKMREDGANPFYDYQVPMAMLKLRQGTGRLIRTMTDRGVVLILDPRISSKSYGRQFLQVLKGNVLVPGSLEETVEAVSSFFAAKGVV